MFSSGYFHPALVPMVYFLSGKPFAVRFVMQCCEGRMVVGRTLWDFVIEVVQTPGLRLFLLLVFILFEIVLIMLLLLIQSGTIGVKLSYGGLGIELNHSRP
jgi:hypothetical protein